MYAVVERSNIDPHYKAKLGPEASSQLVTSDEEALKLGMDGKSSRTGTVFKKDLIIEEPKALISVREDNKEKSTAFLSDGQHDIMVAATSVSLTFEKRGGQK